MQPKAETYFYHLTRDSLERALPVLLSASLKAGWRVLLCGPNKARLTYLDERLWLEPKEGFLAHGRAPGAHDCEQPILLSDVIDNANCAQCLMLIEGAKFRVDDARGFERVCVIFDGNDEAMLAGARAQWKMLSEEGLAAIYWSQETGKWQKKAENKAGA